MYVRVLALSAMWGLAIAVTACTVNSTSTGNGSSGPTTRTCGADSTVTCMQGSGWSCTGADSPEESNPLVCSVGTQNAGKTDYCCVTWNTVSTCSVDTSVTGCKEGTGFSCTGSGAPDQSDTSLVCSAPTPNGGKNDYCCIPYSSSSTCTQDMTVSCTGGSIGFSCTGTDTPQQTDSSLTSCSTPTASNGMSLYCCY